MTITTATTTSTALHQAILVATDIMYCNLQYTNYHGKITEVTREMIADEKIYVQVTQLANYIMHNDYDALLLDEEQAVMYSRLLERHNFARLSIESARYLMMYASWVYREHVWLSCNHPMDPCERDEDDDIHQLLNELVDRGLLYHLFEGIPSQNCREDFEI